MKTDFRKDIIGLTLGIRYAKSFRIPDISGDIVDHILYSSNSPFGTEFFPKLQSFSQEKILHNPKTSEYLRINTDDVILICTKSSVPKIKKLVESLAGTPHEHLT